MMETTKVLHKKNIHVPKLRFKEFDDEWVSSLIEENFVFKNGLNKEKEYFGHGTPIINFTDVYHLCGITKKDIKGLVELNQSEIDRFVANKGDVFFTRTSETTHDIGMASVLLEDIPNCVFSGFVLRATPLKDNIVDEFKKYCFRIAPVRKEIVTKSSCTTRALTSGTLLNKVVFKFPKTKKEQQKIASFLSAVDEKIQQLTRKKELLEQYKKGVMQQLFSGKLRFKDENVKAFPKWEEKRLDEVANFRRGSFPQPYGLAKWFDEINGFPFVQVYDVDDNMLLKPLTKTKISKLAAEQSVFVKEGTLVITIQGSIGRIAKTQYDAYVDRTLLIFQSYKKPIDVDYFKYVVSLLFEIEKTKAPGGTIKTITKEALSSFKINIPQIEEQKKIANYLSNIDNKIESVNKQITQTQTFKKGLLQQMFV